MGKVLGVIGGGNMAEAILQAATSAGYIPTEAIFVSEPREDRRAELADALGVACGEDNTAAASREVLLLAVKPQVLAEVAGGIAGTVTQETLVISIAAGVRSQRLDEWLGGRGRIVRVMPNTPMMAGAGASAVCAGPRAAADDVAWTLGLFRASGVAVDVEEPLMDAVTAVSGSGPAYFFYLVEAMVAAGVAEGLSEDAALSLARQTCLGAGQLLAETGLAPAELRRRVTSPGGTTQRAIETLDAAGAQAVFVRAVRAAAERSRELGA